MTLTIEETQELYGGDEATPWFKWQVEAAPPEDDQYELFFGISAISGDGSTIIVGARRDFEIVVPTNLYPTIGIPNPSPPPAWTAAPWTADGTPEPDLEGIQYAPTGAAFVYVKVGDQYVFQAKLLPEDSVGESAFGAHVAISHDGNTILIGGPADGYLNLGRDPFTFAPITPAAWAGAAWVFTRSGTTWSQQGDKLVPAAERTSGGFGYAGVALLGDGDTALVHNVTGVVVFLRDESGVWDESVTVPAYSGGATAVRQLAVTPDGEVLVLAEPGVPFFGARGKVHVLERSGATWAEVAVLEMVDPDDWEFIGRQVSISDDGETIFTSYIAGYIFAKGVEADWSDRTQVRLAYGDSNSNVAGSVSPNGQYALTGRQTAFFSIGEDDFDILDFVEEGDEEHFAGAAAFYERISSGDIAIPDTWARQGWFQPAMQNNDAQGQHAAKFGSPSCIFSTDGTLALICAEYEGPVTLTETSPSTHDYIGAVWLYSIAGAVLTVSLDGIRIPLLTMIGYGQIDYGTGYH